MRFIVWMDDMRVLYGSIDLYERVSMNLLYPIYIMVSYFIVTSYIITLVNVRIEMVLRMHKLSCNIFIILILHPFVSVILYKPIQNTLKVILS